MIWNHLLGFICFSLTCMYCSVLTVLHVQVTHAFKMHSNIKSYSPSPFYRGGRYVFQKEWNILVNSNTGCFFPPVLNMLEAKEGSSVSGSYFIDVAKCNIHFGGCCSLTTIFRSASVSIQWLPILCILQILKYYPLRIKNPRTICNCLKCNSNFTTSIYYSFQNSVTFFMLFFCIIFN